jgi:CelD/BcsL family acetyltransferase involved in cellulose biosynthesis
MLPSIAWDVAPACWDALADADPCATFFHSRAWYTAHAEALGYRPRPALLTFASGREALLPLATKPGFRGLVQVAHAGLEGGYGGLIGPDPLTPDEVAQAYALVRRHHPDLAVAGNPFAADPRGPRSAGPAAAASLDETQVVPLLDPEAQLARLDGPRRRKVRRGLEAGFRVEVVHPVTPADVARFFPLYAGRATTWAYKRWVRDQAYFEALATHAGGQLALFLAYAADGTLGGFQLLGLQGAVVSALYLATDPEHEARQVGALLAIAPMAWCQARGCRHYDLLASGQLASVKAYKASLGAEPLALTAVRLEGPLSRLLGRAAGLADRWTGLRLMARASVPFMSHAGCRAA